MTNTEDIIRKYKDIIIQISTPYGSGSGFYVKEFNLIATNRHVIAECDEVTIRGMHFEKTVARVLFSDAVHDLAFLEAPANVELGEESLLERTVFAGERIIAIGHPMGLKYTATQGIVSKEERIFNGVKYIQIDAAINPGNSGGPLINERGNIVGINTFIYRDGESLGFAVPVRYLLQNLHDYQKHTGSIAIRCTSCQNIITENELDGKYCSFCGNIINTTEFNKKTYEAVGTAKTIEDIICKLGKDIRLTRIGQNAWDVEEGTALVKITYNQSVGYIYNDAVLCTLPKDNIGAIYEYLLKENYTMQGNSFSVWEQKIILGSIIHKDDIDIENGTELYKRLLSKADYYDNILINQFGCQRIETD